nr:hypothetical protein [Tanacetum cinerariifolium]
MQQTINKLTAFCTSLQRQHSELLAKFQAQEVEIIRLKERVKVLEDKDGVIGDKFGDDAPIKGRSNNEREAPAKRISNDSEDIARVLTSMDAATEVEINRLKDRVKTLEDHEGVIGDISGDDAPIKGRSTNEEEAPAEKICTDSEEIARVLTSMDAATILVGETNVPTGSGSIPTAGPPATIVSTGSEVG